MDWIKLILQFAPAVLQIVMAVETLLAGKTGTAKRTVALAMLTSPAPDVKPMEAKQVDHIGNLIDTAVGALNKAGVFGDPVKPEK